MATLTERQELEKRLQIINSQISMTELNAEIAISNLNRSKEQIQARLAELPSSGIISNIINAVTGN